MLPSIGTLFARSPQGFRASGLSRVACSVALAIGLSLSIAIQPIEEPSIDAINPKAYIRSILSKEQALCLIKLYGKESAFSVYAIGNRNGKVQTYGIPQLKNPIIAFMSPTQQIDFGLKYVIHRYGTPCKAWGHWRVKGWH